MARLDSYFTAFKGDYNSVVKNLKPYHAFTVFCAKYYYYYDAPVDIDDSFLNCMSDGANDGGIDAIFANPSSNNELVIIQGKYYKKSRIGVQNFKDELNKIIDTINGLENHQINDLNDKVQSAFFSAKDDLDEDYSVRIDFCTYSQPSRSVIKKIQQVCTAKALGTNLHIRFLTHDDIIRQVVACETSAETVDEFTLKIDKADNCLKYEDSIVVNISAQSLQTLYQTYKNQVLGRNLRYHIKNGAQAKTVDSNINKTISEKPQYFWYLNNGILIACDSYELPHGSTNLKIKNFSIVNGGQTTYKVAHAADLSKDFFVQCKVVVARGSNEAERSKFCLEIANATNAQKPIKQSDLKANEPEQLALKKKLGGLHFYYVTKAGDKPAKNTFKNYQICNLDKVGKASLAGILLLPGTARSGSTKMFDAKYYEAIFDKPVPNAITDFLTLIYQYKAFQRKAIAKADELGFDTEDYSAVIKNGEKYYLACIGFIAKIKAKAFTYNEFRAAKVKGADSVRELFLRNGNLSKIVTASGETGALAESVFSLLTKRVLAPCCELNRLAAEKSGESFVHTNYLKKDSTFFDDVVMKLWREYIDVDSPLKGAIDALIG